MPWDATAGTYTAGNYMRVKSCTSSSVQRPVAPSIYSTPCFLSLLVCYETICIVDTKKCKIVVKKGQPNHYRLEIDQTCYNLCYFGWTFLLNLQVNHFKGIVFLMNSTQGTSLLPSAATYLRFAIAPCKMLTGLLCDSLITALLNRDLTLEADWYLHDLKWTLSYHCFSVRPISSNSHKLFTCVLGMCLQEVESPSKHA